MILNYYQTKLTEYYENKLDMMLLATLIALLLVQPSPPLSGHTNYTFIKTLNFQCVNSRILSIIFNNLVIEY
ncbi:hypothetical protein EMIT079MI2_170041 [Bacillus sp. IT-79MI2]